MPMSLPEVKVMFDERYQCSELVKFSTPQGSAIGNLERISQEDCTITAEIPVPVGTSLRMRCVECPLRKKNCTECRFQGTVQGQETDPVLGCLLRVRFERRKWSPDAWQPRHLTDFHKLAARQKVNRAPS